MDRDSARDFVVANFHALEDQLLECMEYVPFVEANRCVVSPRFPPILLDACSLIDSVLRDSTNGDERHTLKTYASTLESELDLEDATTLFLVAPLQLLRPFRGWCTAVPEWWEAHNRIKHDRMRNYGAASYSCTVSAVAALHQVIARSRPFIGHIIRTGWFNERSDEFGELGASSVTERPNPANEERLKTGHSEWRAEYL
jgi:hypothetical protein